MLHLTFEGTFEGLFEFSTFVYAQVVHKNLVHQQQNWYLLSLNYRMDCYKCISQR